jgi:FkbM family methyltransferase
VNNFKAMTLNKIVLELTAYFAELLPLPIKRSFYKNLTISRMIRAGLNRFAPGGLVKVNLILGGYENLMMFLDLKEEKDYWLGTYEPELQFAVKSLVERGQVIIDIGANIGFISLIFANITGPEGHVYAFEALPENIGRLRKNIEINGYLDRITVIESAVQDRTGNAVFIKGPSTGTGKVQGSAGRDSLEYLHQIQVAGISIDEFIDRQENLVPDVIKIDIEGGEVLALPGMEKTLRVMRPILFIELHGTDAAQVCWEFLNKANYRISRMDPKFSQVVSVEDLDWKSYIVAFPNE